MSDIFKKYILFCACSTKERKKVIWLWNDKMSKQELFFGLRKLSKIKTNFKHVKRVSNMENNFPGKKK